MIPAAKIFKKRRWEKKTTWSFGLVAALIFVFGMMLFSYTSKSSAGVDDIYTGSWNYRQKITFDNSEQSEDLIEFPVLVKLTPSNFDYSHAEDDGRDIRFVDSDGISLLPYEIEKWEKDGDSIIWVLVPQVDGASSTDYIYILFGNDSVTSGESPSDTWNDDFLGVWHMSEDPEEGRILDSTGDTTHDAIPSGAFSDDLKEGVIGDGIEFSSSNKLYNNSQDFKFAKNQDFTLEIWTKHDLTNPYEWHFSFSTTSTGSRYGYTFFTMRDSTYNHFGLKADNGVNYDAGTSENDPFDGEWHQVVGTKTNDKVTYYIDGVKMGEGVIDEPISFFYAQSLSWGWNPNNSPTVKFKGLLDESRISSVARSDDWIAATYKTNTDDFNTFGAEESLITESDEIVSLPTTIDVNPLIPDPYPYTTVEITGAAHNMVEVHSLEFQVDGTHELHWTSCTAEDGVFDSADEEFTCNPEALDSGSHTIYFRATDGLGSIMADDEYVEYSFEIEPTVGPVYSITQKQTIAEHESPYNKGYSNNISLGPDGFPRMTHVITNSDDSTESLVLERCVDNICSSSVSTIIDTSSVINLTTGTTIEIGNDGFPRITYAPDNYLGYVQCKDKDCIDNTITIIDNAVSTAAYNAGIDMQIAEDGFARIVYIDRNTYEIRYVRCQNDDCTITGGIQTLYTGANYTGYYGVSLDLGENDYPQIVFVSPDAGSGYWGLMYVRCTDDDCTGITPLNIYDPGGLSGFAPDIKIGSDDNARVVFDDYYSENYEFLRCTNPDCTETVVSNISSDDHSRQYSYRSKKQLILDSNDLPRIAYTDSLGYLQFLQCEDVDCGSFIKIPIETDVLVDRGYSGLGMVMGFDERIYISYLDYTNRDLEFARLDLNDATPPIITLDAIGSILDSGSTTITGVASDASDTVISVQYQIDGTKYGSWVDCEAVDGAFDQSSESFVCNVVGLTSSSHTIYIRATDFIGNTSVNSNFQTIVIGADGDIIDTTPPSNSIGNTDFEIVEVNGVDVDDKGTSNNSGDTIGLAISYDRKPKIKFEKIKDDVRMSHYEIRITHTKDGLDIKSGNDIKWIGDIPDDGRDGYEIEKYGVKIEYRGDKIEVDPNDNDYKFSKGTYYVKVRAIDTSGNHTDSDEIKLKVKSEEEDPESDVPMSGSSSEPIDITLQKIGPVSYNTSWKTFYYAGNKVTFSGVTNPPNTENSNSDVVLKVDGEVNSKTVTKDGRFHLETSLSTGTHNINLNGLELTLVMDPTRSTFPDSLK